MARFCVGRQESVLPCSLALFLVFVASAVSLSVATGNIQVHAPQRQFLPVYLLKRNQTPRRYATGLLVQNSSGEIQFFS